MLVADALRRRWSRCSGWSCAPASVTVVSFFTPPERRRRAAALRVAAAVQRPGRRASTLFDEADPLVSGSDLGDHHVEPGAGRPGAPASTVQPRSRSGRRPGRARDPGFAPSSSRPRTSRPLVALLKWLTTVPPAAGLVQHPHGGHPPGEVGRGPPERGVRRGPQVDEQPAPDGLARPPGRGARARRRRPGRGRAAWRRRESRYAGMRSPGRTSPKRRRGRPRRRAVAAAPGGGGQAWRGRGRRRGRRCRRGRRGRSARCGGRRCGRPGRPGSGREAEGGARPARRSRAAQVDERVEHLLAGGGRGGERQRAEVQRLAAAGGRSCPRSAAAGSARRQASEGGPDAAVGPWSG